MFFRFWGFIFGMRCVMLEGVRGDYFLEVWAGTFSWCLNVFGIFGF